MPKPEIHRLKCSGLFEDLDRGKRSLLKTLHLTNSWHPKSGGIATFYRALIAEANRRRQEIRLIVPGDCDRVEEVGDFGRIYSIESPASRLNSDYRVMYPSQFLSPGSKVQNILGAERPDLIEISDKYTLNYLGALLRFGLVKSVEYRPVVVGFSQERMDDNFRAYFSSVPFAGIFCAIYMKWIYFPFFDYHIANSEYTAGELRAAAKGTLVPRQTWIRPMGVNLERFSPARRRLEVRCRWQNNFDFSDDAKVLLYIGRLVPEKNLCLLFETFARLVRAGTHDYRLLIVGDGIERGRWETWCAKETAGRTVFLGHVHDQETLADLYANADVFVHPNPREPFGIAPLEAMASGTPLVAPNCGGVISYANSENAWTVSADVESFASAVEEIVFDPTAAANKTARALTSANDCRWERIAPSFLDLYDELKRLQIESRIPNDSAFVSTPAIGLQAVLMRGAAATARKSFQLWAERSSLR